MDKKKILIISSVGTKTPPTDEKGRPSYGGLEAIAAWEAIELHRRGHEVTLVVSIDSDPKQFPEGLTLVPTVFSRIQGIAELDMFEIVKQRIKWEDYDIVQDHSHSAVAKAAQRELEAAGKESPRFYWTIHNDIHFRSPPPVKWPNVIVPSHALGMRYAEAFPGHVAEVAWHGIPMALYPFNATGGDRFRFLFVGRIQAIKGPHLAIGLCRSLGYPLDVVGPDTHLGADDPYVVRIKSMCDGEQIRYVGGVSHEEKVRYMQNALAVLLPSTWNDPFNLVASESMACGTPILTSEMGGLPEQSVWIDGACCTQAVMAAKMQRIVEMRRKDWAGYTGKRFRSRAVVEEHFTVEKMVDRYLASYERCW